jgi:hypothetical protein
MEVKAEDRAFTLRLTLVAVGLVLGLSSAAVLPLLLPWQGELTLIALASTAGAAPFGASAAFARFARRPSLAAIVSWRMAGAVAALAGLGVAASFNVYRGVVRVLNHADEPFVVWIDGRSVARVEPSSGESALAGVELIVPAGSRDFRVTSAIDGRELLRAHELVSGGKPHLFAPQSSGYCFSIERRGYGDDAGAALESEPLEGSNPFWVLPEGIAWFAPNPEPGPLQTSGGTVASLRQKRCSLP